MTALRLLHPRDIISRAETKTSRVFLMGPQLAPNRAAFEFYPTPPEATHALLSVETFQGGIWEPACGRGHISKVLSALGHDVVSTDLIQRDFGVGGIDFLAERKNRAKHIVTNPPYGRGLGDCFVKHALALTRNTGGNVAMLLNLASLAHPKRHALWTDYPPSAIHILDELFCWPEGDERKAGMYTATHRYCWVVWRNGHTGSTVCNWISTRPFRQGN